MTLKNLLAIIVTLALGAFAFACVTGFGNGGSTNYAPNGFIYPLQVDKATIDSGEVYINQTFPQKVTIRNVSPSKVEIADFSVGCSCVSVEPEALTLMPGEQQEVCVAINLSRGMKLDDVAGIPPTEFSENIVPIGNDRKPLSKKIEFRGKVKSPVSLSARAIFFRGDTQLLVGHEPSKQTVIIEEVEKIDDIRLNFDHQALNAALEDLGEEGRHALSVSPIVPEGQSEFKAEINVELSLDHGATASFGIPVRGSIQHAVYASPSIISCSTERLPTDLRVSLSSKVGSSFAIKSVEWVPDKSSTLEVEAIETNASTGPGEVEYSIAIRGIPSTAGMYKGNLIFSVQEALGESSEAVLSYDVPACVLLVVDRNDLTLIQ